MPASRALARPQARLLSPIEIVRYTAHRCSLAKCLLALYNGSISGEQVLSMSGADLTSDLGADYSCGDT